MIEEVERMKSITIKDYEGNEHSGKWNGSTYKSKVDAEKLFRIYVDNVEINVTKEELKTVGIDMEMRERAEKIRGAKLAIADFYDENDLDAVFEIYTFINEMFLESLYFCKKGYLKEHLDICEKNMSQLRKLSRQFEQILSSNEKERKNEIV